MAVATEQPTPDDVAAFVKLIPTLTAQITQLRTAVRQTTHNLVSSDIQTAKGLSLLDLKIQTLLSYLSNLAFVMLLKAEGGKLEEHPVVDKLIEARTVLEKLRPLETKLRYQIEKLVKGAAQALADARVGAEDGAGSTGFKDPLAFKPNPMNMEGAEDAAAAPAPSSTSRPTSTETYKAPRIAPKFYDEGKKTKKISGRDKEKASRSRLMKDLRSQFENAPEELSAEGTGYTAKEFETEFDRDLAEKERFEEENFIRLNMSKQERKMREKMAKSGGMMRFRDEFADLDDFADIQGLDVEGGGRAKGRVKRKSDFLDDYVGRSGGEGGKGKKSRKR